MLNSCFNEIAQRCGLVFANKTPLAKESYAVRTAASNSPRSHILSTGFTFGGTRRRSGAETARTYSNEQSIAHLSRQIHSTGAFPLETPKNGVIQYESLFQVKVQRLRAGVDRCAFAVLPSLVKFLALPQRLFFAPGILLYQAPVPQTLPLLATPVWK